MLSTEDIRSAVETVAEKYAITRATLFGSRANGTETEESDVDLILEFGRPVTLITLAKITDDLEDILKTEVDVIHGPLRETDMLIVDKEVLLYAS